MRPTFKAKLKRTIRQEAKALPNRAIKVKPGRNRAKVVGEGWHYKTKGGRRIAHPSAYSKSGWSNMVYYPSTKQVTVGMSRVKRLIRQLRGSK